MNIFVKLLCIIVGLHLSLPLSAMERKSDEPERKGNSVVPPAVNQLQSSQLALFSSAKNGNLKGINAALNDGAYIDGYNNESFTALHLAARCGKLDAVKLLIEKGAKIDGHPAMSPLQASITWGQTIVALYLIEQGAGVNYISNPAIPNTFDTFENMLAKNHGNVEVMNALRKREVLKTQFVEAAISGNADRVSFFVKQGIIVNRSPYGRVPLVEAARNGHLSIVKLIVEGGGNIDEVFYPWWNSYPYGETALAVAVLSERYEIVDYLVSKRPNLNRQGTGIDWKSGVGFSPLHLAILRSNVKIAELLINNGANVDGVDPDLKDKYRAPMCGTPLTCTIETSGDIEMIKLLVYKGANLNFRPLNSDGKRLDSPLDAAIEVNDLEIIELLIQAGVLVTTEHVERVEHPFGPLLTRLVEDDKRGCLKNLIPEVEELVADAAGLDSVKEEASAFISSEKLKCIVESACCMSYLKCPEELIGLITKDLWATPLLINHGEMPTVTNFEKFANGISSLDSY